MSRKIVAGMKVLTAEVKTGTPRKTIGTVTCAGFSEDSEGLNLLRSTITGKDVKDLNRQRLTDVANDLRRGQSESAKLKKVAGIDAAKAEIDALIAKYL